MKISSKQQGKSQRYKNAFPQAKVEKLNYPILSQPFLGNIS